MSILVRFTRRSWFCSVQYLGGITLPNCSKSIKRLCLGGGEPNPRTERKAQGEGRAFLKLTNSPFWSGYRRNRRCISIFHQEKRSKKRPRKSTLTGSSRLVRVGATDFTTGIRISSRKEENGANRRDWRRNWVKWRNILPRKRGRRNLIFWEIAWIRY